MKKLILTTALLFFTCVSSAHATNSLRYTMCLEPRDSSSCFIAFQKLITTPNPMMKGKVFFDDDHHFIKGKLFLFPTYYVAEADLDNDGFDEIIATIPEPEEEMEGWFCKKNQDCPHFIFQDRNTDAKNLSMKNVKTFGPIYSYGIGLSTDEKVDGFWSLRSYRDNEQSKFHVYQYDGKTDEYYNITAR